MAIIDRDGAALSPDELVRLEQLDASAASDAPAGLRSGASGERSGDSPSTVWSRPALVLLAAMSAAAGAIHVVMVPSHAGEWLPAGIAFAVAGWVQILLAVALIARPSALAVRSSCLTNALFLGAWLFTRVWGWPVGPEAGVPEAASFVDITSAGFEAALVLFGYELLAKPGLGARLGNAARVSLSVVPAAILVLATAAIASPSARNHAHAEGETAGHSHETAAAARTGAAATDAAAGGGDGHAHDHGTAGASGSGDPAPADDKGLSLIMNGAGEGGGHVHSNEVVPVDAATQAQLDAQLAQMQPFIDKYPTIRDAEAAGYHRQGPYSPGLGTHYAESGRPKVGTSLTMTDEALKHPMLIYDGTEPDSKLAGFMYLIYSLDTQNSPEGFAGPNDHWHYHTDVCIVPRGDGGVDSPLGADASATKELCDKYKGILIKNTGYMVHVWPVPGYESPQGMFSNLNTKLTCPDGSYWTVEQDEIGTRNNICKDVSA